LSSICEQGVYLYPTAERRAPGDDKAGADHLAAQIRERLRGVAGHSTLVKDWL